ncbi:MAG: flippase-like domain-containing protein [bacterium]|nr:flippase-like domain-containing protein [bacterium]
MSAADDGRRRRRWVVLARLGFSLALLAYVLARVDWDTAVGQLQQGSWLALAGLVALAPVSVLVSVAKWRPLIAVVTGVNVPRGRLFGLYVAGQFYNQLLPSSVGGDVARAAALRDDVSSGMAAAASIVVERLTGLVALVLLALAALAISPGLWRDPWLLAAVAVCVAGLGALVVLANARVVAAASGWLARVTPLGWLVRKGEAFRAKLEPYRKHRRLLLRCVLLSFLFYAIAILSAWFAVAAVGYDAELERVARALPVVLLVSNLPIAINGIGITEWAFAQSFSALGLVADAGVAAALLIRLRNALWASAGYALVLVRRRELTGSAVLPADRPRVP